jgi:hypothetical protein
LGTENKREKTNISTHISIHPAFHTSFRKKKADSFITVFEKKKY